MRTWLIITALFLMTFSIKADDTITFAIDNWCPYTCSTASEPTGIIVEVIQLIYGKDNVKFITQPWSEAIASVKSGKVDGLAGALISDAPFLIYQKTAITTSNVCFFVSDKSSWRYQGLKSLDHNTLSVVEGYSYGESLDAYLESLAQRAPQRVITLKDEQVAQQRFKHSMTQDTIIVADQQVFSHQLTQYNNQHHTQLAFHNGGCLAGEEIHIGFSPKNKTRSLTLAHEFELGLQQLQSNGTLAKIIANH